MCQLFPALLRTSSLGLCRVCKIVRGLSPDLSLHFEAGRDLRPLLPPLGQGSSKKRSSLSNPSYGSHLGGWRTSVNLRLRRMGLQQYRIQNEGVASFFRPPQGG